MEPPATEPTEIAYFSMEIAVSDSFPTYSGGLGVLAGDHLRAAADLGLPLIGVTLVYHDGFLSQSLDPRGHQVEHPAHWSPADQLHRMDEQVEVSIGGRRVAVGGWRLTLKGVGGHQVPIYFLDTRLGENHPADQAITDRLYPGDPVLRLSQEAVLGLGGAAMVRALGHDIATYHMNEGHAALVPVALLARGPDGALQATGSELDGLRDRCVFTTHTPVPAGHDRFAGEVVEEVLGVPLTKGLEQLGCIVDDELNMTIVGMFFAGFINGVARRHALLSQAMFPRRLVRSVTNGVHVATWAAPSSQRLFDRHVPGWRHDNALLRYAVAIPPGEIDRRTARPSGYCSTRSPNGPGTRSTPRCSPSASRAALAAYKRNDLLLDDPQQLRRLSEEVGPLQVLYGGKAHPLDIEGKEIIARVSARARSLEASVTVIYLEDYGMTLAALLCAGVDVWLNTPIAPNEASGTSGMKAAINGVPSLSVLDGWWLEGHVEGVTGWAIGSDRGIATDPNLDDPVRDTADAAEIYRVLRDVVIPLYYSDPDGFAEVGRGAMAFNGSFFNTQRMVSEYASSAYRRAPRALGTLGY